MLRYLLPLFALALLHAAEYKLPATPQTVVWGYYSASAKPALRIRSGDIVEIQTLITSTPERLAAAGVPDSDIQPELKAIAREVKDKGPGGHILTGPIFVEGAEDGDMLEVRILSIRLAIPYAYNAFRPGAGFLPEDFNYSKTKIIPLDAAKNIAHFGPGIEIPLRPFFGSMGVAPPEASGRISSGPPGPHAGNLDNKHLVAGTTLYIPVRATGAMFEVGDGHAGQGNGEVTITALETSLTGRLQFILHKRKLIRWPRAETPTHFIAMGIDEDLTKAAKLAVREAIDFLVNEKGLSRDDAYMLCSVAVDFEITQLVDGSKGVHGMIPKSIFTRTSPASR
jgi:acetamidase/formamidase